MKTCIKIRENYGKLCIFISVSVLNDMHQFPLLQTSLTSKRQIEWGHWIIYKRTTSIFKPAECAQTIKNHWSSSEKTSSTNSFIPIPIVFCFNSISEANSFKWLLRAFQISSSSRAWVRGGGGRVLRTPSPPPP